MASPFTFNTAKPLDTDQVSVFPAFARGMWATLATASATGGVLGTLTPTTGAGTPTVGWRINQDFDTVYETVNAWYNGSAWASDNTAKPAWMLRMDVPGDYLSFQRAPASANPPVWVEFGRIDNTGAFSVGGAHRFRYLQSMARSHQATPQSITGAGTDVAITLDTNDFNTDGMWSSGANTRLTAQIAGKYLITAGVGLAAGLATTNVAYIALRKNGTTTYAKQSFVVGGSEAPVYTVSDILSLAAADYIEVLFNQNSGVNINTQAGQMTFGAMSYVGE